MADIYQKRAKAVRTPSTPDTRLMAAFDKKREKGLDMVKRQALFLTEQEDKAKKSVLTSLGKAANQVYKNGYTLYGNQPKEYKEFIDKGLSEVYAAVPDSKGKRVVQANVSIIGSGFNTRVQKNYMDNQEAIRNEQIKSKTFIEIENAKAGLSGLFAMQDNNLSPEQKLQQAEAFKDAQIPLFKAYNQRNRQDSNGNFIYSAPERAALEDSWNNRGRYAVLDYAGDNITTNRKGVVELRNGLVENKQKVQEEYDISDEDFAKTLSDMDKIISRQTTAKDLRKVASMQVVNTATVKDVKVKVDGSVGNKKYNNIDTLVGVFGQLKAAEREGAYSSSSDRGKIATEKGKIAVAIIKHIEDGVDLKDERGFFTKWQRPNVGEVAVMNINKNIDTLEKTTVFQNLEQSEKDEIKAQMYVDVLGGLQKAEGISLDDKDNTQGLELAKKTATGAYYSQIESIVGHKPYVKNPDDPEQVRMAYENALYQKNNEMTLSAIKYQLEVPDTSNYGTRSDKTQKGEGYFGELVRPDGGVSTEVSIGVNLDGKETQIPTLVPTLTEEEKKQVLADNITDKIISKAVAHARQRIAKGLSPFANGS